MPCGRLEEYTIPVAFANNFGLGTPQSEQSQCLNRLGLRRFMRGFVVQKPAPRENAEKPRRIGMVSFLAVPVPCWLGLFRNFGYTLVGATCTRNSFDQFRSRSHSGCFMAVMTAICGACLADLAGQGNICLASCPSTSPLPLICVLN